MFKGISENENNLSKLQITLPSTNTQNLSATSITGSNSLKDNVTRVTFQIISAIINICLGKLDSYK